MDTLLLDAQTWDLTVDASDNIAVAKGSLALAQDAASAIRTFLGEVYYNTELGIPYFSQILGQLPPLSLLRTYFVNAALTVPTVVSAQCFFSSFAGRVLSGQVQITDDTGNISVASF